MFARFDRRRFGFGEIPPAPRISAQRLGSSTEMRRHHEEIAMLPALSLLLPFAGALWLRIKTGRKK
jgi:hypothetical protein